jgi:hypothetical protein
MRLRTAVGMVVAWLPAATGATSPPPLQIPAKELAAEHYTFVTKTSQLPDDIRRELAVQLEQHELRMADAGTPFNSTDVVRDPTLPSYRLIVAAVGTRFVVVHFERGGVELSRWIVMFERTTAGLTTLLHGVVNEEYRKPKELEAAIRTGALWKPSTKR